MIELEMEPRDPILVTGGAGLVGRALIERLAHEGFSSVTAPSRAEVDLCDPVAVGALFERVRPRHVFHAAAKVFGLGGNTRYPGQMFYLNALINLNVVESARVWGVAKITAMGTGCVYPEALGGGFLREDQIWDGAPHGSEWAYAQAKRGMLAHLTAANAEYGLDFAYAISGNLYGPDDLFDVEQGHVIPSLIAKFHHAIATGGPVSIWGTGRAERDFCYSKDMAAALLAAHRRISGPVNIGSGAIVTIREVVDGLMTITGGKVELCWDASKPDGQMQRFYDLSKIKSTGFAPQYGLLHGLRETFEWYHNNYPDVRGLTPASVR